MAKNNYQDSNKESVCNHISAATKLLEKSVVDILGLVKNMEKTVNQLPESEHKKHLTKLVASAYEICTFEDLASQHLNKAIDTLDSCKNHPSAQEVNKNTLLRGPALQGEQSLSQSDIDKML